LRKWADNLMMFALALVLAIIVWIVATQEQNPIEEGEFGEAIAVEVRNQPEGTTFLPGMFDEQVWLTLRAPQSSWRDLRASKCSAWVDLEGHGAGDYEVPVQATCTDSNIRVLSLRPASVPVRLQEEQTRVVPVQIQLYGSAALGYQVNFDQVGIEPETVTVTGPTAQVSLVDKATLDLYFQDVKETFTGARGVVARQANGESVGSLVSIEPPRVQITVPVVQETGFNEVVVRPQIVGSVARGYWVQGITLDPVTVMLVGDPDVVSKLSFAETLPLDITDATGDVVERIALDLPEGASTVGVQGVLITVTVAAQQGSQIIVRKPIVRGLSTDLTAQVSPETVEMTLVGPLPRLDALEEQEVFVYVELVDKDVGEYKVELTYLVPEGLEVSSLLPPSVDVVISRLPPTPTATPTRTATPTATPTLSVSDTLTATPGMTLTVSLPLSATPPLSATAPLTLTVTPAPGITATATVTTAGG
jgi:YbbR domain-containing protein